MGCMVDVTEDHAASLRTQSLQDTVREMIQHLDEQGRLVSSSMLLEGVEAILKVVHEKHMQGRMVETGPLFE